MKKILSIVMVVVMLSALSVSASAEQQVMEGTGTSIITYREPSTYCILIPEYLTCNENGAYQLYAENINITEDEKIYVYITNADENNRILFTHENGEYTLTKEIQKTWSSDYTPPAALQNNCVGLFEGEDKTSKISFTLSQENYDCMKSYAGTYSAIVEFQVSLGH